MKDRESGIGLLEEAIALVRHAPARAWSWYLTGAIPFFAGLLYFIHVTTGALAVPDPAPTALTLALLFAWRQVSRSMYGRVLMSEVSGVASRFDRAGWTRAWIRTWFAGCCRIIIPLPVPYLSVLFRNYQAYAWDEESAFRRAADTASRGGSPLVAWLTLGAMGFIAWLNILTGMIALPMLYRIFTGEEDTVTSNIGALLNQTTLVSSLALAWCLCDVVLEAMCVLRRFYSESETTGADLIRAWRKAAAVVAAMLMLVAVPSAMKGQPGKAGDPDADVIRVSESKLDRAIDEVLTAPKYQWRQPPRPSSGNESAFVKWVRSIATSIRRGVRAFFRWIGRLWDAFIRWLSGGGELKPDSGPAPPVDTLRLASVLIVILLAGGLIALLMRSGLLKRSTSQKTPASQPIPVDLNDPSVAATDLAEDQWLKLAREWMEKGEPRLALRAWFLSCLAWMNSRELVTVSRNKSNLDYRRELARRGRAFPGLADRFTSSVRRFESSWYGDYPVEAADVESFANGLAEMRGMVR